MTSQPILTLLLTDPATTSLVGQQIYPKKAPQKTTPPYVAVRMSSANHLMSIEGPTGTGDANFEVHCYAFDTPTADAIGLAVSNRLKGFKGLVGPTNAAGSVNILGIFEEDDEEDWEQPFAMDEAGLHSVRQTFRAWMQPD